MTNRSARGFTTPVESACRLHRLHFVRIGVVEGMTIRHVFICLGFLLLVQFALPNPPADAPAVFEPGEALGDIDNNQTDEISGMAASRLNPGILWVQNDSGDQARIYALDESGDLVARFSLNGASNSDWEDLATARDPDNNDWYIYAADIGDNGASKSEIAVYRAREPGGVVPGQSYVTGSIANSDVQRFRFEYPDGPRNAETLLVDPATGDFYIISKQTPPRVYRSSYPHNNSGVTTLDFLGTMPQHSTDVLVGGDISPDGTRILVKDRNAVHLYCRAPGDSILDALQGAANSVPYIAEPQGEAIAWGPFGDRYYTASEQESGQPTPILYRYLEDRPLALRYDPASSNFLSEAIFWDAQPGRAYQIERSTDIDAPVWSIIGTVTPATTLGSFTDNVAANSGCQYFYRVVRP